MLNFVLSTLGTILYPLFSIIFVVVKLGQDLFYAFAGMGDKIYYKGQPITAANDGGENSTGILYHLMQTQLVKDMLISITLLAIFLLIIFSVMAFIKNAYSAKPKTWQEIVGNAFKGLANFVFIPVCCLLGVWLGNILLQAINGATSKGGSAYMDRNLFISCAYNANVYRADAKKIDNATATKIETLVNEAIDGDSDENGDLFEVFDQNTIESLRRFDVNHDRNDYEYYAKYVDMVYANSNISIYDWGMVANHYYLWNINYLTLVVGGVFMLYVLLSLAFAMVRRIFILLMLFIISPAMCAMYPLDDGKAVGSWKGDFVKQTISAYGAVAGMNLFFSLLPLIQNIEYGGSSGILDGLTELFLLVAGLFCVKELISKITGYIGADDAYSSGASLMKNTTKVVGDRTKKATKTGAGAFAKAMGAKSEGGSFWGSIGEQVKTGIIGERAGDSPFIRSGGLLSKLTSKGGIDGAEIEKSFKSGADSQKTAKDMKTFKDMSASYDKARDTDGFDAEKMLRLARKLGIEDEAYKKLAGANKMSVEEYKENVSLQKDFAKQEKAFNKANARSKNSEATIDRAISALATGDTANFNGTLGQLEHIFGVSNIGSIITNSGLAADEFLKQLRQGVQISADKLDVDKVMAAEGITSREDAIDRVSARTALNQMIDEQKSMNEAAEEAADAFKEAAESLKKMHASSDASGPVFTTGDILGIQTAIDTAMRSGSTVSLDPAVTTVMKDLKDSVKDAADKFKSIDIDKAVKKASSKKSS